MKKFLSAILALSLLLSGVMVSANASGNEITLGSELRCTYEGGPLVYTFTPEETVRAMLYTKDATEGADTNVIVYRNDLSEPFGDADDNDEFLNFCFSSVFEAGYTYTFEVNEFFGSVCEFTLVFEKSPIESIEAKNIPVITCDISGNYIYNYSGIEITVNYTDSKKAPDVITSDGSSWFEVDGYELVITYEELDEDLYLLVSYRGFEEYFSVETEKKAITGFEILTPPNCTVLYEDADCTEGRYYDEESYEFKSYRLYNVYFFGISAKITYEDESSAVVTYEENPEFFTSLENDLYLQTVNPWGLGKHTVKLFLSEFSDSFEVEVVENPFVKAEITRAPNVSESLFEGYGRVSYDQKLNPYFLYETPLDGIQVTLTDKNGKETVISDAVSILTKLSCKTKQETEHWVAGDHEVDVYYGCFYVGSYTYTVSDMYISELSVSQKPLAALYYAAEDEIDFIPEGAVVKAKLTNGKKVEYVNIPYEDMGTKGIGACVSLDYSWDGAGYCYTAYSDAYGVSSPKIYFDVITKEIASVEITNPPASLTHINQYGIDVYSMDLTGLEVTVTTTSGETAVWKWDSSSGTYNSFFGGVLTVEAISDYLEVSFRGITDRYYPETKDISEYSKGVIDKNTTLQIDLNRPELQVYAFTPWIDGTYNFTSKGKPLTVLAIYNEYCELENAVMYEEQLFTNVEKETYTGEFSKGKTYYILVMALPLFGEFEDGNIDFTVESPIMIGDVTGDGMINTKDVLLLRKYLSGTSELTREEMLAADCDGSGTITTKDVLALRKYISNLVTELPVS